jgi:hypothetical protein
MRRFVGSLLILATLFIAAAALIPGPRPAEANGHPRYMWEPIIFQTCLAYPLDCDVIIVHG